MRVKLTQQTTTKNYKQLCLATYIHWHTVASLISANLQFQKTSSSFEYGDAYATVTFSQS